MTESGYLNQANRLVDRGASGRGGRPFPAEAAGKPQFSRDTVRRGSDGDDVVNGDGRAEIIWGGRGNDRLHGGGGGDVFTWLNRDLGGYQDVVTDFSPGQDRLLFRVFDPKLSPADCLSHFSLSKDGNNSVLQLKDHQGQVLQTVVLERTDLLMGQESALALARLQESGVLLLGHGRGANMISVPDAATGLLAGKAQLSWGSQQLDANLVQEIAGFIPAESIIRLAVFDPSLPQSHRLGSLSLLRDGQDSLLQLRDFHGKLLHSLRLEQVDLLQAEDGSSLSSQDALQRLCRKGSLLLLDDVLAPAVTHTAEDRDSGFLSQSGGAGADLLISPLGRFDRMAVHQDGAEGNDRLQGGRGDDLLHGGAGDDRMTGRGGRDVFSWNSQDVGGYTDTITDFNPDQDVLRLQLFDCSLTASQRLSLLTLEQRGEDSVLLVRDHAGQIVQTVILADTELLLGDRGEKLTSAQALWQLHDRGALQLLTDEGLALLTQGMVEAESHFITLRGDDQDQVLRPQSGLFVVHAHEMEGLGGDDVLEGAGGDDVLRPGRGNDYQSGRGGSDTHYWRLSDLDGGIDTVRDFSIEEDVLRFDVFQPELTRQQRLDRLSLVLDGADTLLVIHDACGQALQTVRLQDVNLLRDGTGVTQSSDDALQRLGGSGVLLLSYDEPVNGSLPPSSPSCDETVEPVRVIGSPPPDLSGSAGRVLLHGDDFDNRLKGTDGADFLLGLAGDDWLDGGGGDDVLAGGSGADTFFWGAAALMRGDRDIVRDFDPHEDQLVLSVTSLVPDASIQGTKLTLTTHGEDQWLQLFESGRGGVLQTIILQNTSWLLGEHGYALSSNDALHKMLDVGALILD